MLVAPWAKRLKSLLSAATHTKFVAKTHALIILTGIFTSDVQLVASYAALGDIRSARKVFDEMPRRGVDAWNAMAVAYSRKNLPDEVLGLFNQMMMILEGGGGDGVRPDSSTFTVALKACTSTTNLNLGKRIWRQAGECGYGHGDVFVASAFLNLLVKCGDLDEAAAAFDRMPRRDVVCWATMITGFARKGCAGEALGLYAQMRKDGVGDDGVVMVGLIQACTHMIAAAAAAGGGASAVADAERGREKLLGLSVHGYIIRKAVPVDVVGESCLVDMYAKSGHLQLASRVFDRMRNRSAVSWSTLVSGFAKHGLATNALDLLRKMISSGLEPDSVALVAALLACSQIGLLKLGRSLHGYIVRKCDSTDGGVLLSTSIIDMYSKCGALSSACAVFRRISPKDSVSWNAMIASYGMHGHGREALSHFLQMMEAGLKPDDATLASLLSALSHAGLVDEGRHWFDRAVTQNAIRLEDKHYACLVDLLARAGRLEEALELVNSMKSEPAIATWVALLSGCCTHGNLSVGEKVAKHILGLNPAGSGVYTLVSNFFAKARMWEEVAQVRRAMKEKGDKKVAGCSTIEVNGELRGFVMEDESYLEHQGMVWVMEKLEFDMRRLGSISDLILHDLD